MYSEACNKRPSLGGNSYLLRQVTWAGLTVFIEPSFLLRKAIHECIKQQYFFCSGVVFSGYSGVHHQ
jgi:hypothetical protein